MAKTNEELKNISTQVRRDILRMVCAAKSGHPGGSMSSADFLTALFFPGCPSMCTQKPSQNAISVYT